MMTRSLTPVHAKHHLLREEDDTAREQKSVNRIPHVSVLTKEIIERLAPEKGELVLDATAGAGGHSEALLQAADIRLVALDADPVAVANVTKRLERFGERARVIEANFKDVKKILSPQGTEVIDKAVYDLGWNRTQLTAGKGFSFLTDEPLLMSYGATPLSGFTAKEILNSWSEKVLADIIFGYGEEKYARKIAKAIVSTRKTHPIETTGDLVSIIEKAVPPAYARGKIHPGTRTFQALRIAVNDELSSLEASLKDTWDILKPQGRIAVISFHSLEDRVVKRLFLEFKKQGGELLSKKPIAPTSQELRENPSARSAKLRVIQKN